MLKGIFAITREHELVKMVEVEYPEEMRATLESAEGVQFPMFKEYEGCTGELVGIE